MKTTLDLPDELMRAVRIRAAEENLKVEDVVVDLLRLGFSAEAAGRRTVRNRVRFPLVRCAHPAKPGEELTPERIAALLAEAEVSNLDTVR